MIDHLSGLGGQAVAAAGQPAAVEHAVAVVGEHVVLDGEQEHATAIYEQQAAFEHAVAVVGEHAIAVDGEQEHAVAADGEQAVVLVGEQERAGEVGVVAEQRELLRRARELGTNKPYSR